MVRRGELAHCRSSPFADLGWESLGSLMGVGAYYHGGSGFGLTCEVLAALASPPSFWFCLKHAGTFQRCFQEPSELSGLDF